MKNITFPYTSVNFPIEIYRIFKLYYPMKNLLSFLGIIFFFRESWCFLWLYLASYRKLYCLYIYVYFKGFFLRTYRYPARGSYLERRTNSFRRYVKNTFLQCIRVTYVNVIRVRIVLKYENRSYAAQNTTPGRWFVGPLLLYYSNTDYFISTIFFIGYLIKLYHVVVYVYNIRIERIIIVLHTILFTEYI